MINSFKNNNSTNACETMDKLIFWFERETCTNYLWRRVRHFPIWFSNTFVLLLLQRAVLENSVFLCTIIFYYQHPRDGRGRDLGRNVIFSAQTSYTYELEHSDEKFKNKLTYCNKINFTYKILKEEKKNRNSP